MSDNKNKEERKIGVAVIYDPHNLYQFIWYYATYGQEYDWIALCLPNGYKGEYMSQYCEKCGIFKRIIKDKKAYLNASIGTRAKEFTKMLYYAIKGKQNVYCKNFVSKYIDFDQYEIAVVLTDVGIVSGAFVGLSREKKTVILEDGMGDYADRSKGYIKRHLFNPYDIQGYLVAKMGYANPAHYYPLKTTKYCEKFCSNPEQMLYRDYKSITQLYDHTNTDMALFEHIVENVYEEVKKCDLKKAEAIIFTDRLYDFGDNVDSYIKKFENYVNTHYKSIILKRHPRDETQYLFSDEVEVQEINNSVPAEVILPYLDNKKILFMFTSSILLYMKVYHYHPVFLYFKGLYEQNLSEKMYLKYITKETMNNYLKRFDMEDSQIVDI